MSVRLNGKFTSSNATKAWDINQLRSEQKLLQLIHEKYWSDYPTLRAIAKRMTGVELLDYKSRIEFGCNGMGYTKN